MFPTRTWLPALAALALAVMWCVCWWRRVCETRAEVDRDRSENSPDGSAAESKAILYLMPMAGIFTTLAASGADFPLRETGLALVFFFLAGALVRTRQRRSSQNSNGSGRTGRRVFAALASVALAWSAFIACRNALACASSPWRGQLFMPIDAGTDTAKWERSIALDPGDEQLHYWLATAADNAKNPKPDMLAAALEHTQIAAALSLEYNKARQAAITQEILELTAGAAAQ